MKKTDAQAQLRRAERQLANTSGGGHLGGTKFGQAHDAKTASGVNRHARKARPNNGKN
jgi:hypothetical protein